MNLAEFEQSVIALVTAVRDDLKTVDSLSSFTFSVDISGPVHSGDVNIEYKICKGSYGTDVIGNRIQPVLDEFKRRHGWTKDNKPLCISFGGEEVNAS